MRCIIYIYVLISLISCKEKHLNHYHGVIVNKNLIPISGVIVKTDYTNTIKTETQKNGYFKLSRKPNEYGSLIFFKKGYKKDTIRTIWAQSGELLNYSFINKKLDTIILIKSKMEIK